MNTTKKFWDRIANRYSKITIADDESYQKKLKVTREYLQPSMNVLELGCGTGTTAVKHAGYVQHIRAVDISPKMLEIAKAKAQAERITNIDFEQAEIDQLQVDKSSVNAVLAMSILHLLENKETVIKDIYTSLKPGGVFISSTSCLADSLKIIRLIAPIGRFLGLMPVVKVFTTKDLLALLQAQGFEIEYQWQPDISKAIFIVAKKPAAD